jgi:ribosomal protein S12 methylthiotransferase accessory factor
MTTDIGLPVICVYLFDAQADAALNPISAPYGAGCHIDGATALIRALTESAQTRVGWIAGSRDDLSRDKYKATQAETHHLAAYVNAPCAARLEDLPVASTPTVEEDIAHTIRALQRVSLGRVIVVPLHDDAMPVAIAKVIVPGLEAPRHPDAALGKRARAVMP